MRYTTAALSAKVLVDYLGNSTMKSRIISQKQLMEMWLEHGPFYEYQQCGDPGPWRVFDCATDDIIYLVER